MPISHRKYVGPANCDSRRIAPKWWPEGSMPRLMDVVGPSLPAAVRLISQSH